MLLYGTVIAFLKMFDQNNVQYYLRLVEKNQKWLKRKISLKYILKQKKAHKIQYALSWMKEKLLERSTIGDKKLFSIFFNLKN